MADVMGLAMLLVILGGAYWVMTSGVLNNLSIGGGQPAAGAGEVPATGTTPTTGTGTKPTTGNPLEDALSGLLGGGTSGGSNTIPTTGGGNTPLPSGGNQQPFGGNPAECKSRYNGSCSTECKSGNSSICQACQLACGGAAVGAINVLPPVGGGNASECKSKYNGKCDSECKSGNSSQCQACKAACGSFYTYVRTPMSLMTSTVFRNDNHSYYTSWGNMNVQNAR